VLGVDAGGFPVIAEQRGVDTDVMKLCVMLLGSYGLDQLDCLTGRTRNYQKVSA
jgi:hypothetical protein